MASAVIFDMDGLLIDSEPLWVRAEIEVFAAHGVALREEDCAETKGLRIDDVVAYWNARSPFREPSGLEMGTLEGRAEAKLADVAERLVDRVSALVTREGVALPGVEHAIATARQNGRRIALASSSPTRLIEAALERLGLKRAFDVVQSAQTEPYGKPHPGIFIKTAERLGVRPTECVVIEDSMTGVIAAKAARMRCIAVPFDHPNHEPRFALADLVLGSLTELDPGSF